MINYPWFISTLDNYPYNWTHENIFISTDFSSSWTSDMFVFPIFLLLLLLLLLLTILINNKPPFFSSS